MKLSTSKRERSSRVSRKAESIPEEPVRVVVGKRIETTSGGKAPLILAPTANLAVLFEDHNDISENKDKS
jgi:hypothetical protein